MSVEFGEFQKFAEKLKRMEKESGEICEACAKELAGRFLALVMPETPVGKKPKFEDDKSKKVKGKSGKSRSFLTAKYLRFNDTWDGYIGGTLRRGWIAKTHQEAESGSGTPTAQDGMAYIQKLGVSKAGNVYSITLYNPVKYAPYVEYGHRQQKGRYVPALGKRLVQGFAPGKFYLRRSIDKLRPNIPAILNKRFNAEIKKRFDNG